MKKQDYLKKINEILNLPQQTTDISSGGTVTSTALKKVYDKLVKIRREFR